MSTQEGIIFNIQRFSINDGPGIRTTVFMKGCMLDCIWCHNPESKSAKPQLLLNTGKCIGCGDCLKNCPSALHAFDESGVHRIDRASCAACGSCVEGCVGALEMSGKTMTIDQIIHEVLKDKAFYDNSGGGMTVSGGDPMFRPAFTLALLKAAKDAGLHTCIETSGYARWEDIEALMPYTDLFLWDVKETDDARHREFTGVSNARIFENLRRLDAAGGKMVLRCPLIPGYNDRDEHFAAIAALAEELQNVQGVDVEPFHPLGKSKAEALGESYALAGMTFPEDKTVKGWIEKIASGTSVRVQKA